MPSWTSALLFAQGEGEEIIDSDATRGEWLRAGVIVVGTLVLAVVAVRLLRRLLQRAVGPGFTASVVSRVAGYVLFVVGLFYGLGTLGVRVGPLLGALGLGGLVLALALQRVVENFVGGMIIQSRRPFTVGDTVELVDRTGTVLDVDARVTILRGLDGSEHRIPNSTVISEPIQNLTRRAHRRSSVTVGVAYETELGQAHRVLERTLQSVKGVVSDPRPDVVLEGFGPSSIDFTLLFWHTSDVPSERAARHEVVLAVHRALTAADITIAFPQMVVWPGEKPEQPPYG
jgi:small conductance mechanosensitive channel